MLPYYEWNKRSIFISYSHKARSYPAHFHNSIEITYCFSGEQRVRAGDKEYTLKTGEAIVIFPNIVHEEICGENKSDDTEVLSIICSNSMIAGYVPYINNMYPVNPVVYSEDIADETKYAFREMTKKYDNLAMIGWTFVIMSDLLRKLKLERVKYSVETGIVEKLTAYITMNFRGPLTLQYIAQRFGVNKSYLSHVFSDKIKINFRRYLGTIRAEYAARLIRESNNDLTSIAFESGFGSLRSFNRAFSDAFGITPSDYRKNVKKYSIA